MRGSDTVRGRLFSYVDLEKQRVRADHPLRVIRGIVNATLAGLSGEFDGLYSPHGRESIPPERLLRALLLQAFYSIRSERQLVERIEFDLLFRWFVGLGVDDPVLGEIDVTAHVAQNLSGRRSAIDDETARDPGYTVSLRIRKRIEEAFGWAKTAGSPSEVVAKQAELAKEAFEKVLGNMRELAEMVTKAQQGAIDTMSGRISQTLDEVKHMALKMKEPFATQPTTAAATVSA